MNDEDKDKIISVLHELWHRLGMHDAQGEKMKLLLSALIAASGMNKPDVFHAVADALDDLEKLPVFVSILNRQEGVFTHFSKDNQVNVEIPDDAASEWGSD